MNFDFAPALVKANLDDGVSGFRRFYLSGDRGMRSYSGNIL